MPIDVPLFIKNYLTHQQFCIVLDIFEFTSAIFFGFILSLIFIGRIAINVRIDYDMPHDYMLRIEANNKMWLCINPRSSLQIAEAVHIYLIWKLFSSKKQEFAQTSFRRVKFIVMGWLTLLLVISLFGVISTFTFIIPW